MTQCLKRSCGKKTSKTSVESIGTKYDKDGEVIEIAPTNPVTVDEVIEVIEELLLFQAYTEYGCLYSDFDRNDKNSFFHWRGAWSEITLRNRINYMREIIMERFPRKAGSGWDIQKFHEITHTGGNITEHGQTYNYNCWNWERFLKHYGKNASKTVKKIYSDAYTKNVGLRVFDDMIITQVFWKSELHDADLCDKPTNLQDKNLDGFHYSKPRCYYIQQKHSQWTLSKKTQKSKFRYAQNNPEM